MTPTEIDTPPPAGYKAVTFAADQPEYLPLPAWVEELPRDKAQEILPHYHGSVITRWEPTAEELQKLLAGDTICLEVWTFGNTCRRCDQHQGLQPIRIGVWSDRVACIDGSLEGGEQERAR